LPLHPTLRAEILALLEATALAGKGATAPRKDSPAPQEPGRVAADPGRAAVALDDLEIGLGLEGVAHGGETSRRLQVQTPKPAQTFNRHANIRTPRSSTNPMPAHTSPLDRRTLLAFLEACEWICLYPINPLSLQKFRETFVTRRGKDDAKDALYLVELALTHHDKLKPQAPEDSQTRAVQQQAFHRRAVVDERTGLTSRLQALLKQYFPQALVLWGEDL
jgi:hypothetical protein